MASIANETEQACKAGLQAQLLVDGLDSVSHRAFWIDDELSETEEREYASVIYMTLPAIPNGYRTFINEVAQTVRIATHKNNDPKREDLVEVYESVRAAIDSRDFGVDFTSIGSSRDFDAVMIQGSDAGVVGNESFIELNLTWTICN